MPRAAWLGLGAALGAISLAIAGGEATALGAGAMALITIVRRIGQTAGRRSTGSGSALLALAAGSLAIALRGLAAPAGPPPAPPPGGEGPWVAIVETVGSPRDGNRPAVVRLDGEPPITVAATLPWFPPVVPGDSLRLRGRIRPPPEGGYGEYLARIGASGSLRADSMDVLAPEHGVGRSLEELRRTAAAGIDRAIPEPEAGLAAGVLVGLRDRVDRDLAAAFTTAGASHVVAISGWNIAIVASTIGALAGGLSRRRRSIVIALAIVGYVLFVGPTASVVRAGVMAGTALLARELGRPGTAAAVLGWAVTLLLLLDPGWVADAGFQLSVLATAGIIAWGSSLTELLAGSAASRPRRWLAEILGVSLAAQGATLPAVLLDFGRLSVVAPLVNLGVVPLVPPAMAAGVVAMAAGIVAGLGAPGVFATLAGLPAWALNGAMIAIVRAGADLPLASVELGPPWDAVAAGGSALAIGLVARFGPGMARWARACPRPEIDRRAATPFLGRAAREPRRRMAGRATRVAALALAAATIGLALAVAYRPDGSVRVVVLDVGQGDAILVETGTGGRLLVDGGPDPGRLAVLLDERLPPWDHRIDVLVLTHPHEDHVAGLALLVRRYRVGRVYEPGMAGPGPGYASWRAAFEGVAGAPFRARLAAGDRFAIDRVRFTVLWPDAGRVPAEPADTGTAINNVSLVLLGQIDGRRFLLTGDVEEGVDPELTRRGLPRVDLLKVAHHGSRTASTDAFLEQVRPSIAVISAGAGNPYGHPAPKTVERLRKIAPRTYRTDLDGTVEVVFDGTAIRARAGGPRPRRTSAVGPTLASTGAGGLVRTGSVSARYWCAIPVARSSAAAAPRAQLGDATFALSSIGPTDVPARLPWPALSLPRLAPSPSQGLRYHPDDAQGGRLDERVAPSGRPPRLLLGRRHVRAASRGGRVRPGCAPVPERRAGPVAARAGAHRSRPPPRAARRAAVHGRDVRRRDAGGRPRRRGAGAAQRGPRPVPGPACGHCAGQRARVRGGDGVVAPGPAEPDRP